MKQILAIMNQDMVDPTRKLLSDIGITSVQIIHALGRSNFERNKPSFAHLSLVKNEIAQYCLHNRGLITDSVMRKNRTLIEKEIRQGFHPKRMIVFTARDEEMMTIIYRLMNMYAGWGRGKGKIFVCPVAE